MTDELIALPEEEEVIPDPWDQLPDEPDYWYMHFTNFRLLGPGRTVQKYTRWWKAKNGGTPGELASHNNTNWTAKARMYRWRERALAWDTYTKEMRNDQAEAILTTGLALMPERVDRLSRIADKLESYILDPKITRISPYVLEQYRGILDDIAKEVGQRVRENRWTGPKGGPIVIETAWGRGGSASEAWNSTIDAQASIAQITEVATAVLQEASSEET